MPNVSALLERLDVVMKPQCDVIQCRMIDEDTMVRLLRSRELTECGELVRVVYSSVGGKEQDTTKSHEPHPILQYLPCNNRTAWIRHVMMRSPQPTTASSIDPLTAAYVSLCRALACARATANDQRCGRYATMNHIRRARALRSIRTIPNAYRTFCDEVNVRSRM
jgi:hypothetical protein